MSNARKVSTDALETLGTIVDDTQKRDAIHIAVLPIVATERLHAGQHVGLVDGGASTKSTKHVGIVDPFLSVPVQPGQRFWLLLYPRMVTSLRHVWSHPAFTDDDKSQDPRGVNSLAEQYIRDFAGQAGITYEDMLESARDFAESGEHRIDGGRWEGIYAGGEFWDHYETVTGEKVEEGKRGGIFSCSC